MRRVFTEGRSSTWAAIELSSKQKYPANNGSRAFWADPLITRASQGKHKENIKRAIKGAMMSVANTPII
jgi:hypothetical protein